MSKPETDQTPASNWWEAYPTVKSSPALISPEEIAELLRANDGNLAVIDVRRNDHAGGHVRGSTQCPAQSFYDDLPTFLERYRNTEKVAFYCSSSAGRGPRCAGWYQDYLNERGTTTSTAYVLQGGIKAWLAKYESEEGLVDKD
jgi:rhodanese-related sulfurtransferase